jgi:hypothetical protein
MLGTHMADEAQLYDLAFSDGSFISVFNTENNTVDVSGLTDTQRENVVGIVYYRGNPTTDDGLLRTDYPDCTHGLILALKDMTDGKVKWQQNRGDYSNYSVSEKIEDWDSKLKPNSNNSILIENYHSGSNSNVDTEKLNKILGYNNTKLLRAFNHYYSDNDYKVRPIEYLDLFVADNKAPESSSGWFLPSPKELALMVRDDVKFEEEGSSTDRFTNIQNILEALDNASMVVTEYWSSSESKSIYPSDSPSYNAWLVYFTEYKYGIVGENNKLCSYYLRAVCAF